MLSDSNYMNVFRNLIIAHSFLLSLYCFGQDTLSGYYLKSRVKADFVVQELIKMRHFDTSPYVLLSSSNHYYYIILDRKTHYSKVWVQLDNWIDFTKSGKVKLTKVINESKPNDQIKGMFDFKKYHENFLSFDSEFYKDGYELASGAPSYFVAKNIEGIRYGESVLSILVSPNPIDKKIYGFMASELINGPR